MEWFALRDGKITHRWGARDSAAIFRQMGIPLTWASFLSEKTDW
jgi:uncharacterized membrane protein YecN with MAPEG domain